MIDLQLDELTHALTTTANDLVLTTGVDTLVQNLKIRLQTYYGEWAFDTSKGVRYFQSILIKNPDLVKIKSILKNEILGTDEVNKLLAFSVEYAPVARTLVVSFQIDTIYGPVSVEPFTLGA
jgi:hypothetical protein